jgi:hypothetical protein
MSNTLGGISKASLQAFKDMQRELPQREVIDEVWFIRPSHLQTKETRKLNRDLLK